LSSRHSRPRLFVYGTLRRGFENRYAHLLDGSARYLGTARVRGRLYDLGQYPGIRLGGDATQWVTGDLFRLRNADSTLATLDAYEGSEFERVSATAELPGGERLPCWIYEYKWDVADDRRIVSGEYRPANRLG
jgi:gamma-glutamylcyclotransferase (GGCT)/AIG2-like uncharacterized protein YtfP